MHACPFYPPLPSHTTFFCLSPMSAVFVAQLILGAAWPSRGHIIIENWLFPSHQLSVSNSPSTSGGVSCPSSPLYVGCLSCAGLVHVITIAVDSHCNRYVLKMISLMLSPTSASYILPAPSPVKICETFRGGCDMCVLFRAENTVSYSLHLTIWGSLCQLLFTARRSSLMRVERCSNL